MKELKIRAKHGLPLLVGALLWAIASSGQLWENRASAGEKPNAGKGSGDNQVLKGKQVLLSKGCVACHSEDGSKRVGPTLQGVFGTKREVITNGKLRTVLADEAYIRLSIENPKADLVKGFENLPMVSPPLSKDEMDAVVAYIKSLAVQKKVEAPTPATVTALAKLGRDLVEKKACTTCHSLDGSRKVAPSFLNIYGRQTTVLSKGSKSKRTFSADEAYLRRSILEPDVELVAGYHFSMMPQIKLETGEVDAILAFLKIHKGEPAKVKEEDSLPPLTMAERTKASQIYFNRCAGCHGMLRKGATGPALVPERLRSRNLSTASLQTFITYGLPGGMPAWGQAGVLSPSEVDLIARFLQHPPPDPAEMSLVEMRKNWKLHIAPKDRPTKPEHTRDWQNYLGVVLRDAGKVAVLDGKTKEVISIVPTGFAVHILRSSGTGRYFYSIGRDGRVTMIDLWMKTPAVVAEGKTCYDARSVDSSKYKGKLGDYMDKLLIVGCYWPPSLVVMDGQTLEPKKVVSTSGYTYDTGEFLREARVAAISASHHAPVWIVNIKETGYIWVVDYRDLNNLKISNIAAERFLHDGGFDSSRRYILMAANARHSIAVVDLHTQKLTAMVKVDAVPHPGRGANIDHKTYGPIWCTGHLGAPTIACLGTDPEKHPKNAWKVVGRMTMPGAGGGNLFVKTHPKSPWLYADRTLNPSSALYRTIYVFDKQTFKLVKELPIPTKYPGRAVHIEYNKDGTEAYISAWSPMNKPSAVLVYDDKTLTLKQEITGNWMVTPTGKWNVFNTMGDIY